MALPTEAFARAVKAKTRTIYAASPLFNGGFTEALSITNPEDGKKLFPDPDPKKWKKALTAIEDLSILQMQTIIIFLNRIKE